MTQVSSSHQTLQCPQCSEAPPVWMHSSCESPWGTSSHFPLAFNGYLYFTSVSDSIKEKGESLITRSILLEGASGFTFYTPPNFVFCFHLIANLGNGASKVLQGQGFIEVTV